MGPDGIGIEIEREVARVVMASPSVNAMPTAAHESLRDALGTYTLKPALTPRAKEAVRSLLKKRDQIWSVV
jgi:hypothetical protein